MWWRSALTQKRHWIIKWMPTKAVNFGAIVLFLCVYASLSFVRFVGNQSYFRTIHRAISMGLDWLLHASAFAIWFFCDPFDLVLWFSPSLVVLQNFRFFGWLLNRHCLCTLSAYAIHSHRLCTDTETWWSMVKHGRARAHIHIIQTDWN